MVYQRAGEIWLLDPLDAKPKRLDIRLDTDRPGRTAYTVPASSQLGSFALDPTGHVLAAEARGTVHWLPGRDEPARPLLAEPGVRGRLPVVIPGKEAVVCASDSGGEDGLDVIPADGGPARRIGHGEFGRVLELAVAPDGRTAAVACADGRLLTVALEGEPVVSELARSTNAEVTGLAFSPDSALLAWAQPWLPRHPDGDRGASQIRLARLADGTVTDVTPPRFDDSSPAFTLDGRHLAFLSNRAFDPVHDTHLFDLGLLPGVRPYLVPLLATTPSPFAPRSAGPEPRSEATRPDGADHQGRPASEASATSTAPRSAGPEPRSEATRHSATAGVDLAGLAGRIVPFPVAAGRYDRLRAVTGGVVWLDLPRAGQLGEAMIGAADGHPTTRLVRYDLDRCERSIEVESLDDYAVCADGGGWRTGPRGRCGSSPPARSTGRPSTSTWTGSG
ncbi:hypothetical protein Psuf_070600 [Phytohabitans suffuscus]|uniref:Lipoprotein LpqB beta-propeller domain-containing protein n=1 Tax=Phytohabitans suffuscus TaxID=624315 RepID=A0A6F8YUD2_9ACTN|nr:hypothetical protein Psuf_070600 [Phytohabitans suffuscus]